MLRIFLHCSGCSSQKRRQYLQHIAPHAVAPSRPCIASPAQVHEAVQTPLVMPQKVSLHSSEAETHGLSSCAAVCRRNGPFLQQATGR